MNVCPQKTLASAFKDGIDRGILFIRFFYSLITSMSKQIFVYIIVYHCVCTINKYMFCRKLICVVGKGLGEASQK